MHYTMLSDNNFIKNYILCNKFCVHYTRFGFTQMKLGHLWYHIKLKILRVVEVFVF